MQPKVFVVVSTVFFEPSDLKPPPNMDGFSDFMITVG